MYAVGHILVTIILLEFIREYIIRDNEKFPRYYILVGAIGSVIPDFDFFLYFIGFSYNEVHRTFMHTIFIPLLFLLIGLTIQYFKIGIKKLGKRHIKLSMVFYIFAFGCFVHLILDSFFFGPISPFTPISSLAIGTNILDEINENYSWMILPIVEGILLLFWIFWMEFKLKITRYL